MIHLGTSGYSFRDWVGPFYPPGIPQGKMLDYYVQHFSTVEINSTYYRLPHPKVMSAIERKTPPGFRFVVKFPGEITHKQTRDPAVMEDFLRVIEPLENAGKFHGALAQFPWSFRPSEASQAYLSHLRRAFGDRPIFAEFRHDSWVREETWNLLRASDIGFCCVDEPRLRGLLPPLIEATTDVGYVRFHGRNARDWWGSGGSQRYNYLYTDEELKEWVDKIRQLSGKTRETFVFFNNCHAGRAVQNAKQMAELLSLGGMGR